MPELPEVETIRRQLESELIGDSFAHIEINDQGVFKGNTAHILNVPITQINRLGKYIFVATAKGSGIAIHLKMTGRMILNDSWYRDAEHTRIRARLTSGRDIYYWDTRKFGYWHVVADIAAATHDVSAKLGPDPWEMNDIEMLRRLQKTGRSIKDTLLDQSVVAGVGNIYVNDALFLAGIDPRRRANSIPLPHIKTLLSSLRTVLEKGLATGGASDNTYRDLYGKTGAYQKEFLVYGRTDEPCLQCGRTLTYFHLGGRGTWMCIRCQK